MENLFASAKFGDLYVTEDGVKNSFCSFTKSSDETLARLYREGWGVVIYHLDGSVHSGCEFGKGIDFSIKCKYIESDPIDDEELDKLAEEEYPLKDGIFTTSNNFMRIAFKKGYRKAKEE